jgi:electron transfer flavoprotein beta subunit
VALALELGQPVKLLSAGPMPDNVARDYLALGAPVLEVLACDDPATVAATLLPALRNSPWVLTGTRAASEQGSGMLPHVLATLLNRPVVTDVIAVQPEGASWIVTQALPKGARRRLRVSAPAVLAISAAAPQTLRHSLADAMAGQIVCPQASTTPLGSGPEPVAQRVPATKRRKVLEALVKQSGHARMLGAIESPAAGGIVLQSGTPHSKAQAVLDYLRTHSLVPF